MAYSGKYYPKNPKKYVGDRTRIFYRSLWERKFMVYCDTNKSILEWGSEEVIIPYISPWDGRVHRYFPDFYIKVKQKNGSLKKFIIEIKPKKQTKPPRPVERKTKKWINEVRTWGINEDKWKSATKWCEDNNMKFQIITEDHLDIRYK